MRIRIPLAAAAAGLTLAVTATACGGSDSSDTPSAATGIAGPGTGTGKTITVWYMEGDLTDDTVTGINTAFEKATGAKVKVEIQQWDGINTKLSTTLAQDNPPDVIDMGNSNVPLFAASGGLVDITAYKQELSAGQTWLDGLAGPATIGGKLYGAPLFAGNRAVVYNKKIWSAAGVTAPPKSYEEFTAALDKIKAKNKAPDFSAFYLPAKDWHQPLQFLWDAGGQIATQSDGKWAGALESPEAIKGLQDFKDFQNAYSVPASQDTDNLTPNSAALFASGKAASILTTSVGPILKANPALKDELGTFPLPGKSGKAQPVFLGGSDLVIPAKSKNLGLALAYLKAAASPEVQKQFVVGVDGWTPVSTELIDQTAGSISPLQQGFAQAAKISMSTPAAPGWSTIEGDKSLSQFFADIATGRKTPRDAAEDFDAHLDRVLNAAP
ncbi:extracellular solute-binding protein [Acrocarpospora catenulata]|uniref:extracellular solute-binding protein n=1 Tax=Acrocarpospora catenulata TaxID=2836182 RepID=UPI001BD97469|nr:extracellular solute-binding protein [Acrocarpospora catenulata]